MRSELVFEAVSHVSNRYQLCQLASKAIRKLHRPHARVQDTANLALGSLQTFNRRLVCAVEACGAEPAKDILDIQRPNPVFLIGMDLPGPVLGSNG